MLDILNGISRRLHRTYHGRRSEAWQTQKMQRDRGVLKFSGTCSRPTSIITRRRGGRCVDLSVPTPQRSISLGMHDVTRLKHYSQHKKNLDSQEMSVLWRVMFHSSLILHAMLDVRPSRGYVQKGREMTAQMYVYSTGPSVARSIHDSGILVRQKMAISNVLAKTRGCHWRVFHRSVMFCAMLSAQSCSRSVQKGHQTVTALMHEKCAAGRCVARTEHQNPHRFTCRPGTASRVPMLQPTMMQSRGVNRVACKFVVMLQSRHPVYSGRQT